MTPRHFLSWLGAAALLFTAACSGDDTQKPATPDPEILSFTSSAQQIEEGGSATLSWETRNATTVAIHDQDGVAVDLAGAPAELGSVTVRPAATTTYTLTAANAKGKSATASVQIEVLPPPPQPVIELFTATPEEVPVGGMVTLAWRTAEATSVEIVDAGNRKIALGDAGVEEGEVEVEVRASTTFTLRARGPGGIAEASRSVVVHGAPQVVFQAPAAPIEPGDEAILTWSATEATSIRISAGGQVLYDGAEAAGSLPVQPEFTTTYLLEAAGLGGQAEANATVRVKPVIDRFEVVSEGPYAASQEVDLEWAVRGATSLDIRKPDGSVYVVPEDQIASGTARLTLSLEGSFTLRAASGSLVTEARVAVQIDRAPFIEQFTVTPQVLSASEAYPAEVTLAWFIDNAASIQIEAVPGGRIDLAGKSSRTDSVVVRVVGDTEFLLTATNPEGSRTATASVRPVPTPTIASLEARPAVAAAGETVSLTWATADAVEVRLFRDGVELPIDTTATTGSFVDTVVFADVTATYVLKAYNSLGFEVTSAPVVVTQGQPQIVSFEVSPHLVGTGHPLTFTWQTIGGQSLAIYEILEDGGEVQVCPPEDRGPYGLDEIPAGSCTIAGPPTGMHTYALDLRNGLGEAAERALVEVRSTDGPVVYEFEVDQQLVTVGDTIQFDWVAAVDAAANWPTLTLVQGERTWDLGTAGPDNTTWSFVVDEPGLLTFTLRAETEGTTPDELSVTVDVRAAPSVESFAATPDLLDTIDGPTSAQLAWNVVAGPVVPEQTGASVTVVSLGAGGETLAEVTEFASLPSGSIALTPEPGIYRYRITVDNGAGRTAEAETGLAVDLARIDWFEVRNADGEPATEFVAGEEMILAWETTHATEVSMPLGFDVVLPQPQPLSGPYIAVSEMPGAQEITSQLFSNSSIPLDEGAIDLVFPEGFYFPWNGVPRDRVRITTNGYVTFNLSRHPSSSSGFWLFSNNRLPHTTGTTATDDDVRDLVHIAVFWDDLRLGSGGVWWAHGSDELGPFVAIEWKNVTMSSSSSTADLTFAVVLRPSGVFEYHFGDMLPTSNNLSQGSSATIGYQDGNAGLGLTLSHDTAVDGGLSNKAWRFVGAQGTLEPDGSVTLPALAGVFTLTASNAYSEDTASTPAIVVHPAVALATPTVTPAAPVVNETFTIGIAATHATSVEVLDEAGVVLCSGADLTSCEVQEAVEGSYTYTVRAVGAVARNVTEREVTVYVYQPFSLEGLTADVTEIDPGETVTLSWSATGAARVTLTANGEEIALPPGTDPNGGTVEVSPERTTTYVLTVYDEPAAGGDPRAPLSDQVTVVVRSARIDPIAVSASQIARGGSVEISWSTTGADTVLADSQIADAFAWQELVGAEGEFIDVSASGGQLATDAIGDAVNAIIEFPAGFTFPWFGRNVTALKVFADGLISFDTNSSYSSSNTTLPATGTSTRNLHLMPFWDDLESEAGSAIWWKVDTDPDRGDYLVVQWKDFQPWASGSSRVGNLNFEVVLWTDGTFDYRYGTMTGNSTGRANGNDATIGWQDNDAGRWALFSYNTQVPDGLSNRAWRFFPSLPASGSVTIAPEETTTVEICATTVGYQACTETTIVVVNPGDVMISEIFANPAAPLTEDDRWFEIRNAAPYPIDISGWEIRSGDGETFTLPSDGPIVLEPGEFRVFGSGEGLLADAIDFAFGPALTLDPAGDLLSLHFGTLEVDRVEWTAEWFETAGASLEFDFAAWVNSPAGNDVASNWCVATDSFDGGANLGSPGTKGVGCSFAHYDVDPASNLAFIDIADDPTATALATANSSETKQTNVAIGFSFPFFGTAHTVMTVSPNGRIGFNANTDSDWSNTNLPSTHVSRPLVAVFWDDLINQTGSSVKTAERVVGGQRVRIVQWTGFKPNSYAGTLTFQAQLWENGDIVTAYKVLQTTATGAARDVVRGSSATFGIDATNGGEGRYAKYAFDTAGAVRPGQAILYSPKP